MNVGLITVVIIVGLIAITIIVTVVAFISWRRKLAAAAALPCALVTDLIFPDLCVGTCPPGQGCGPTTTRRYLIFFTQHATCACAVGVIPAVPPAVVTTGGAGTTGGGPSPLDGIAPVTGETSTGDKPPR